MRLSSYEVYKLLENLSMPETESKHEQILDWNSETNEMLVFSSATPSLKQLDCNNDVIVHVSREMDFVDLNNRAVVSSYEVKTLTKWQMVYYCTQKTVLTYSHDFSASCLLYGW